MRPRVRRRTAVAVGLFVVLLTLAAEPVAAQSLNRDAIDRLNTQFVYVALPLTVFVELILVYVVVRFRDNDDPRPTADDPTLEITWTIATAIILLFVGLSAYTVLGNPYITPAAGATATPGNSTSTVTVPEGAAEVRVLAYRFGWQFTYPDANVTTQDELVLPDDRDVYLRIRSADVLHSLYVPRLGIKKDAFPGSVTTVRTNAYREGTYRLYCTELCGPGHARMTGNATVVSGDAYESWLAENEGRSNVTNVPTPAPGTTSETPA